MEKGEKSEGKSKKTTVGMTPERAKRSIAESRRKIKQNEVYLANRNIQRKVKEKVEEGFQISEHAMDELEHIIEEFGRMTRAVSDTDYEIAFVLEGDDNDVVTKIHLHKDQSVNHIKYYDNASPIIFELKREGRNIVGYAHSHGQCDIYQSDPDDRLLSHYVHVHGKKIKADESGILRLKPIKAIKSLIVNARKETPFALAEYKIPEYYIDDTGEIAVRSKQIRYDTTSETYKIHITPSQPYDKQANSQRIRGELVAGVQVNTIPLEKIVSGNLTEHERLTAQGMYDGVYKRSA